MNIDVIKKYYNFFERTKDEPIVIFMGSRRSGKTTAILQRLGKKFYTEKNKTIQIFTERPEQRSSGVFKDFNDIWQSWNYKSRAVNTQLVCDKSGSSAKFINIPNNVNSFDYAKNIGKADIRFANECNVFSEKTFENLLISNREQFFLDYNPIVKFWIDKYITDKNFLKTTWKDNPFLTKPQIDQFKKWVSIGKKAEPGSYDYWRWQVLCEGNYCDLLGDIFTTDNIRFIDNPGPLTDIIIFADPSNAKGNDYFALVLCGIDLQGRMVVIDSFSENDIHKKIIAETIRKWQRDYNVISTYIETNGEFGKSFYDACINSNIDVTSWYSRNNKFERIMSNYDIIINNVLFADNENNRNYVKQIYQFKQDAKDIHDDNIDCLNNAVMAYIAVFGRLLQIF